MSNIGNDAGEQLVGGAAKISMETVKLTADLTKKILDFIFRMILEKSRNKQGKTKAKKDFLSKVKYGEIDIKKLLKIRDKENVEMECSSFDAEDLPRLKEIIEQYGGRYALVDISPSNTASIMFPKADREAIFAAMKQVTLERAEQKGDKVKFKEDIIPAEDMSYLSSVLEGHDIPANVFTMSGKTLVVVPEEHEQALDKAVKEAEFLKGQEKNIDVISFKQTQDLSKLDYIIEEMSVTEAIALNKSIKNMTNPPVVDFVKDGDKVTVKYSSAEKERISGAKDNYLKDRAAADELLTEVVGNEISVNKKALLQKEETTGYLTRIPEKKR